VNTRHDTTTPTLSVIDPRALVVRSVAYCRHPDKADIESRITRQIFDEAGRQVASWDPRLYGVAPKPNLATLYALSGQDLLADSVDAGWQVRLLNEAGSMCSGWDARGSQSHRRYDDLQRPLALTEQAHDGQPHVVERWTYAKATDDHAQHNQCGRPIRHDDPAGNRHFDGYGLAGAVMVESRRFLIELETPDWPLEPDRRDDYLEETTYVTRQTFTPTGELQHHTDAVGNLRTQHYNIAGQACATRLLQAGEGRQPKCLVSAIRYNAQGQIESETAGNGVIARAEYSRDDGRLLRLLASVGTHPPLQDLNYVYDPVGNIISLEDKTQVVSWFNSQRIDPVSRYRYDSLYQLVEASGWEVSQPSHGPALPELLPTPLDPNQRRNYTQKFDYDAAGNLITRHHSGAPGFAMYTSHRSNRSLMQRDDGSLPGEAEIAQGFDAAGNQLELQRGQAMTWNVRNELSRVVLVQREAEVDDYECFSYDISGHRSRKVFIRQTAVRILDSEVRYLPGLQLHRRAGGEEYQVIETGVGRASIKLLHWPCARNPDQLRFGYDDLIGSSTVELDDEGCVLTLEQYYPFGGTACWAGRNAQAATYKTVRYSGKERDATGLYYYGYRYYAPWLQRWISADPQGDGLNLYAMVANNPTSAVDSDGLKGSDAQDRWRRAYAGIVASRDGVWVRTVARGIVAVDIVGGNELFNRMGMNLTRLIVGNRSLAYLSIDSTLRSKVAGAETGFRLNTASGEDIKAQAAIPNAGAVAYINGGFFNMRNQASSNVSPFAPIGPSKIGGKSQIYAPVPSDYRKHFVTVRMRDGSRIESGPVLSQGGEAVFPESHLDLTKFLFDPKNNQPGKLGHAGSPNIRSGISLPGGTDNGQRTRLAWGGSTGRSDTATGYTMPEWSRVMARLEGINGAGGWSVNLDGGHSAGIGVVGTHDELLYRRPEEGSSVRSIANFIAYYEKPHKQGFFKKWFS
jgi:insecticidal toxin complex protein TccC